MALFNNMMNKVRSIFLLVLFMCVCQISWSVCLRPGTQSFMAVQK